MIIKGVTPYGDDVIIVGKKVTSTVLFCTTPNYITLVKSYSYYSSYIQAITDLGKEMIVEVKDKGKWVRVNSYTTHELTQLNEFRSKAV